IRLGDLDEYPKRVRCLKMKKPSALFRTGSYQASYVDEPLCDHSGEWRDHTAKSHEIDQLSDRCFLGCDIGSCRVDRRVPGGSLRIGLISILARYQFLLSEVIESGGGDPQKCAVGFGLDESCAFLRKRGARLTELLVEIGSVEQSEKIAL